MKKVVVLEGIPGSGKTEYAKSLAKIGYVVCSSDEMRERLYDNIDDQEHNAEVFQKLHEEIKEHLKNGENVVYDACNINSKRRRAFINSLSDIDCIKEAHILAVPYDMVLEQNQNRERVVPVEVINRMYKSWQTAAKWEGFDRVVLLAMTPGNEYSVEEYDNYQQNNPYHKYSLGQHMRNVAEYVAEKSDDELLYEAALRHDAGKPFCEFKDDRGISHYYGHESVGAYDVLTDWNYDDEEALELSQLINYHMYPMRWDKDESKEHGQKLRDKYHSLWGDDFYNKIMLLYEADVAQH